MMRYFGYVGVDLEKFVPYECLSCGKGGSVMLGRLFDKDDVISCECGSENLEFSIRPESIKEIVNVLHVLTHQKIVRLDLDIRACLKYLTDLLEKLVNSYSWANNVFIASDREELEVWRWKNVSWREVNKENAE